MTLHSELVNFEHLEKCKDCREGLLSVLNMPQVKMVASMMGKSEVLEKIRDEITNRKVVNYIPKVFD